MGQISWLQTIILSLIPLGQLWARIFNFKGSLDKWWLMFPLFLFPPLSFIPLLMMKMGFIADGKGTNPVDTIMLLPIIVKFTIPFILPYFIDTDSETFYFAITMIIQLASILIANLTRYYQNCNTITFNSIGKATIDSTISYGIGELIPMVIGFIPVIGIFYSIISSLPIIGDFVDSIIWTIAFAGTYIVINMFNQDNIKSFCNTPFTGKTSDIIPFIISLVVLGFKLL